MSTNVSNQVEPPRPVKYESHPLNGEKAKQLLEAAKGVPLEAMLTLAVATWMRRGELLALRWADIDVEERCLWVRHTMNRAGGHGLTENAPKTETSKRKIVLPQFVLYALMQQRSSQAEIRTKANGAWQERDIVFSNNQGGFIEPSNLDRKFKNVLRKAGLPNLRFHDLRHSAATILLTMGVHPKQVQELLGHSSITITMDRYSQVLPTMKREMMDRLDNWFGK